MKGILHKGEHNEWLITCHDVFQLHPDDCNELFELEQIFDNLEARIKMNPIVEFNIIEYEKLDGIVKYAKLTQNEN